MEDANEFLIGLRNDRDRIVQYIEDGRESLAAEGIFISQENAINIANQQLEFLLSAYKALHEITVCIVNQLIEEKNNGD